MAAAPTLRPRVLRLAVMPRALLASAQHAWLRLRIRGAEADCEALESQMQSSPVLLAAWRSDIADMRCRLDGLQPQLDALRSSRPLFGLVVAYVAAAVAFVAWVFWQ